MKKNTKYQKSESQKVRNHRIKKLERKEMGNTNTIQESNPH